MDYTVLPSNYTMPAVERGADGGRSEGHKSATVKSRRPNLRDDGADPDADEQRIAVESVEDIPLTVDLARVDLVEESHHDERVEDDGEVLRGRRM